MDLSKCFDLEERRGDDFICEGCTNRLKCLVRPEWIDTEYNWWDKDLEVKEWIKEGWETPFKGTTVEKLNKRIRGKKWNFQQKS